MIDKIKINSRESGMALVFAIGLLALLLAIGIAFVGNAVNARRAAENNSARTQARMFAMSALSRAAASLMINAHQFGRTHDDELPDNFNHLYSFDKSFTFTDWLFDKDDSESLMRMDNILSKSEAMLFNDPFKKNGDWKGNWVFFRDGSHTGSRILGRAAWQVIGSSAQILAPVFFRGHLKTIDPVDDNLSANDRRWGREIDEVNLIDDSDNTAVFYPVNENMQFDSDENAPKILDYVTIYNMITGSGDSAVQRWAKKWFYFDHNGDASPECPSMVKAESYGHNGRSYMRFNISELWQDKYFENPSDDSAKYDSWDKAYNVSSNSSDPWYARLGIDTEGTSKADANSDTAITRLTTDALLHDGVFDYEIVRNASTDGYSGLPFLRRIGNSQGTFDDLATLRKQIAANFNDYCDADDVPTSNVSADTWKNNMWGNGNFTHPSYTGNEKTPYLYELGMNFGFVSTATVADDANDDDKAEAAKVKAVKSGGSNYQINAHIKAAPIVKLCNMYPFKLSNASLNAYVDFGQMDFSFKLKKILIPGVEVTCKTADVVSTTKLDLVWDLKEVSPVQSTGLTDTFNFTGRDWKGVGGTLPQPIVFQNTDVDNESGQNPYPTKYSNSTAGFWQILDNDSASGSLTFNPQLDIGEIISLDGKTESSLTFKSGASSVDALKTAVNAADTTVTITLPNSIEIREIEITEIVYRPQRIVLTATTDSGHEFGIDYVKDLDALTWDIAGFKTDNKITAGNDVLTLGGTQGILLSGYRNIDPRQNLNKGDWYDPRKSDPKISDQTSANIRTGMFDLVKLADFTTPASAFAGNPDKVLFNNGAINYHVSGDTNPYNQSAGDKDWETVIEPAYQITGTPPSSKYISTAVIRNAPMMSPWEIGFIHRGVKWQTLNIKNSMMPTNGFADNGSNWDNEGTTYTGGDGAIFEQIKMVDQSNTYGKINVNLLHPKHLDFRTKEDKAMVQALFQGIRYGENPLDFIKNSTRDSNGEFPTQSGGTLIDKTAAIAIADDFILDDARSRNFSRRSDFLNHTGPSGYEHWCLESGYSATIAAQQKTDAAQEEIIGKTINLLSAEKSSPNVVEVTVVAQSIKDMEGTVVRQVNANASDEYRTTSSGNYSSGSVDADGIATKTNCTIGDFDMYEHKKNDDKNVYFDEITGEVKMRATFIFDQLKRRLRIGEVDYL